MPRDQVASAASIRKHVPASQATRFARHVATEDPDESGSSLEPRYFAALLVIETWAACNVPLMS
jgi:hypothetical protein